ncbi:MAG: hypothetical protein JRI97_11745 [Deltaproteobacteria bacterium]|nr:hypothetical protein [Deltaproteobacteria bacterium]
MAKQAAEVLREFPPYQGEAALVHVLRPGVSPERAPSAKTQALWFAVLFASLPM